MKKISVLLTVCLMGVAAQATTYPIMVDDFANVGLGEYTQNWVLEQSGYHGVSFASPSGALQVSKEADTGAEQVLFLRDDYHLAVGEMLRIDKIAVKGSVYVDFGIALAAIEDIPDCIWTSGTADARQNYVTIYLKASYANIGYVGFDGTTNMGSSSGIFGGTQAEKDALYATVTGLFISQTAAGVYDLGYTTAAGDTVAKTFTMTNTAIGTALGFYADVRATTTYGDLDNLRIVPEPATMLLLGIGSILALRRRK